MQSVRVLLYLSLATGNDTRTHPHPFLGRISCAPLFFLNSFLRVAWLKCPVETAGALLTAKKRITIFGNAWGSCQSPVTSFAPKFWCYLIWRIGSLWGHFWSSLATGIAVWSHSQIFFVLPTRGTYKLFNSALHHLSPQRTSLILLYSPINELK